MSNLVIGFTGLGIGLLLMVFRVQIGVALGLISFFGIAAILNMKAAWGIVTAVPYSFVGDWNLSAVPMFLLMGYVASSAGLTAGLFRFMRLLLSRLPGGLGVASVGACALFAAASGSSVATSSAMARIATPEMLKYKYEPGLASGVIAASGTLGSLIPPSILLVLYGYFAEVSIAKLFVAGFLPGILSAALYMGMIVARASSNPELAPPLKEHPHMREIFEALREVWPLPVLIGGVLAGIFIGVFTPTEAGAVGAFLAFLIAALRGSLSMAVAQEAMMRTLSGTAGIFIVVIGTVLLTRFVALAGVPTYLAELMLSISHNPLIIILVIAGMYVLLGMFVDSIGLLLLTLPIILPVVNEAGMDLIWFGIIVIKLLEIGLVTPPVGLNVYVIKGALGNLVSLQAIFRGIWWFILMDIAAFALIVAFPQISLFLPSLM
ncbi:TRAP transporter large permease [Hoeflea prorocentri]|uniref:TRAP transporter large permease protein n=1 Tax=Hoeflea prorocentri TaxID=1922333 RepID=A0A9X3UQY4_9HYPH|nr:TRAP transporter large permease [Hoeflea prorocentri]MCY6383749.1 TRAP transporter large permease [Hoeflea prorocentri]MDA5401549.1 TRAP transporter large permease [Hoeflea prorocentri]